MITIETVLVSLTLLVALLSWVRNDKGIIRRRIEKKERQKQELYNQKCRVFGLNGGPSYYTSFDKKIDRLNRQIETLKNRL